MGAERWAWASLMDVVSREAHHPKTAVFDGSLFLMGVQGQVLAPAVARGCDDLVHCMEVPLIPTVLTSLCPHCTCRGADEAEVFLSPSPLLLTSSPPSLSSKSWIKLKVSKSTNSTFENPCSQPMDLCPGIMWNCLGALKKCLFPSRRKPTYLKAPW